MIRVVSIFFALCGMLSFSVAEGEDEAVILLHGLARSSGSMGKMEKRLGDEGYQVHNIDYPSTEYPVEEIVEKLVVELAPVFEQSRRVHFVTHSMGGIIVRQLVKTQPIDNLGRVVMLSPPNGGSEVVDALGDWKAFKVLNGPAGQQLGTGDDSLPSSLGPVDFELGIITGDRSINWVLSGMIPGVDDGKVSVENAQVEGMDAFKVVHATHPMIMRNNRVIDYVIRFLSEGVFEDEVEAE